MSQLDKDLKDLLHNKIDQVSPAREGFTRSVKTRIRIHRSLTLIGAFVLVGVLGTAGFALQQAVLDDEGGGVSPATTEATDDSGRVQNGMAEPKKVSDVVTIAEGIEAGEPWRLRAYTAVGQEGPVEGQEELCVEFKFASDDFSQDDFNCQVNRDGSYRGPYTTRPATKGTPYPKTTFYGPVPGSTTSVEIKGSTDTREAEVKEAPAELEVSNDFFVGFAPPDEEATVTIYGADHAVWSEKAHKAAQ